MKWVFLLGVVSLAYFANGQNAVVQDAHLYTKPSSNIFVKFSQSLNGIYSRINRRTFANRGDKITAIQSSLEDSTKRWHQPALDGIKKFGVQGVSFWITNEIYVKGASPLVVAYLSGLTGVESITEEVIYPLERAVDVRATPNAPPEGEPWGVPRIGAPHVWNHTQGSNTGETVRVGIIDSGVRATHEALKDNFVGLDEYGWYDADEGFTTPSDADGHGTHVTGTVAGKMGIGVAPGASWMHCKAGSNGLPRSALTACGQFMLCPHDVRGQNKNCTRAPHVINNSWGSAQNDSWYDTIINAWNEAGIIPVFAIGNSGPNCGTYRSPGDRSGVISVGNTARNESIWWQSSRGPPEGPNGDNSIPMISAPGTLILSAYNRHDSDYTWYTGTSQAAPHVAGAIALLKSRNPDLTRKDAEDILFDSTFRNMLATGYPQCGNRPEGQYPNNVQGWGRLDVRAAYEALLRQS